MRPLYLPAPQRLVPATDVAAFAFPCVNLWPFFEGPVNDCRLRAPVQCPAGMCCSGRVQGQAVLVAVAVLNGRVLNVGFFPVAKITIKKTLKRILPNKLRKLIKIYQTNVYRSTNLAMMCGAVLMILSPVLVVLSRLVKIAQQQKNSN